MSFSIKAPWQLACGLGLALCLAGCATYHPRLLSPADTAAKFDARRLDAPELRQFMERNLGQELQEWPLKRWDLEKLTLAAFYHQPSLDMARAQWATARDGVITAGGRPNPTVSATPGYNFNAASGVTPWIPGVNFDLPIETAGKRGHRLVKAQQLSAAARWNLTTAAWQVRSALRASLVNFNSAAKRHELLQEQLATQQQALKLLEQRVTVGALAASEIQSARIALEKTRLDASEAQRLMAEGKIRLAEAVGVPVGALAGMEFALPISLEAGLTSSQARQQALSSRADIAAALAEYEAAQAALQLEIAKQYPDVHLGTGYQWDQGASKWSLGLTVELPVLNRNQGPIAEAESRRTEAAARFLAVQAKAVSEIDRAVAVYRGALARVESLKDLSAAQAKQHEAVATQMKAGASDQLELLNATVELRTVELLRSEAAAQLAQALGALEDAVQKPLDAISPAGLLTSSFFPDSISEPAAGSPKTIRRKANSVPSKKKEPKK